MRRGFWARMFVGGRLSKQKVAASLAVALAVELAVELAVPTLGARSQRKRDSSSAQLTAACYIQPVTSPKSH